jgi:BirA family biotin operon repressor/biotin-[acetyl-CoA-carboxylase] ligase
MTGDNRDLTPRLPPAFRLVAQETVDSTNAAARRLAEAGAEDGTVVWARAQTQGRGRRGRDWISPAGNLYASLVLRPETGLQTASQLGFAAALALLEALGRLMPPLAEVTLKWPNDVLLNERKVAGVLLESVVDAGGCMEALILGVGLNVVSAPTHVSYPVTCLSDEGAGAEVTPEALLEAFAPHFQAWVNRWLDEGFGPLRQAWLARARGLGEPVTVRLPRETLCGTFQDLDAEGALVLRRESGAVQRIHVGDVFFGRG